MIKNERQYRISRAQARRFQEALTALQEQAPDDRHPLLVKAELDAVQSQWEELQADLAEYEDLRSGKQQVLEVASLSELPSALIKARIASGLSQKHLAKLLGLKEQQVQRYESTDYSAANLERLTAVAQTLNVQIREEIVLPSSGLSVKELLGKFKKMGIDRRFLCTRVLPPQVAHDLQHGSFDEQGEPRLVFKTAAAVGQAFGWPLTDVLARDTPQAAFTGFGGFKAPQGVNERRLFTYAFYANTIALLVLRSARHLQARAIPSSPQLLRADIMSIFGRMDFENTVRYLWRRGVAVLPLDDPGAFHGACWKVGTLAVVALNQSTQSAARWLFDLLHELRHLLGASKSLQYSRVELSPISPDSDDESEDEIAANNFAEDVLLDSRADDLAELCVTRAKHSVERLKAVVPQVAAEQGVEADALANHLAYRLAQQEQDWWGAATNLQITEPRPVEIARRVLFEHIDPTALERYDRELLLRSQTQQE